MEMMNRLGLQKSRELKTVQLKYLQEVLKTTWRILQAPRYGVPML